MSSRRFGTAIAAVLVVAFAAFLVAPASSAPDAGPKPAAIPWLKLDEAVASAGKSGRPIMVNVYADWCGYCRLMDRTTFVDPTVVRLVAQGWVASKLNGESSTPLKLGKVSMTENQWAVANGVQGFPAMFLLDSKGKPFAAFPGYLDGPQLRQFLQDASTYLKTGGASKNGDFFTWVENKRKG